MTLIPCDALLFDLDGTLVDTAPDLAAALNHVLSARCLPPVPLAEINQFVGKGARVLIAMAMRGTDEPSADDVELDQAVADFLVHYEAHLTDASLPYPGVPETLQRLAAAGFKVSVVTNKPERLSRLLLDALGLSHHFALIIGSDTLAERKPHPLPLHHAVQQMGVVRPVMVGDSEVDIVSARNAQMPVIAVNYGYNRGIPVTIHGPDRIIDRFPQLIEQLQYSP